MPQNVGFDTRVHDVAGIILLGLANNVLHVIECN